MKSSLGPTIFQCHFKEHEMFDYQLITDQVHIEDM